MNDRILNYIYQYNLGLFTVIVYIFQTCRVYLPLAGWTYQPKSGRRPTNKRRHLHREGNTEYTSTFNVLFTLLINYFPMFHDQHLFGLWSVDLEVCIIKWADFHQNQIKNGKKIQKRFVPKNQRLIYRMCFLPITLHLISNE